MKSPLLLNVDAPEGYTFIYTLADEKGVRYVGKADNLYHRMRKHLTESKHNRTIKEKWIFSRLTADRELIIEVLDTVPANEWSTHEIYWIAQLRAWGFELVNGTEGGEGSNGFEGRKHSEATRARIREKRAQQGAIEMPGGESHHAAKLTTAQVEEMRIRYAQGDVTYRALGAEYGVSHVRARKIVIGEAWKQKTL